jgi:hypothetical protein
MAKHRIGMCSMCGTRSFGGSRLLAYSMLARAVNLPGLGALTAQLCRVSPKPKSARDRKCPHLEGLGALASPLRLCHAFVR